MTRKLKGRRIAVLAADGFEKIELSLPAAALRLAGAKVDIVSLRKGRIRGVNLHEPASRTRVHRLVGNVSPEEYDALYLPGGLISPDLLRQSREARELVRAFDEAGKPIAVICHGAWLLASAALTQGRVLTSWPGTRDDLVNAGATWVDEPVVRDGNWLSSRGPQDLRAFIPALVGHFAENRILSTSPHVVESAPPRNQPPRAMLRTMRWMPRPSLRTALGLVALAVAGAALGDRRRQSQKINLRDAA